MKTRRAVFLDRDGTLNEDVGYPGHWRQIHVYPQAYESVRRIRKAGFAAVVVTNQSGIGRGYFTESELLALHGEFRRAAGEEHAHFDGLYYCPHYFPPPDGGGCACRKPHPGMGLRAAAELGLDLEASFMVGDKAADILFGRNIGAVPVLVLTGFGNESLRDLTARNAQPAHIAPDLLHAVDWILARGRRPAASPRRRRRR